MKEVIVHPERCMGCMQCMIACATAHSKSKNLFSACQEVPLPRSRIHIGVGLMNEGFPNRCRHCDPAPCIEACLTGAFYRDDSTNTICIDPDKCINCASCAMACPFGVIRFYVYENSQTQVKKTVAMKCDNCHDRQKMDQVPACAEACKSNALTFETHDEALKRKTNQVAQSMSKKIHSHDNFIKTPNVELYQSYKQNLIQINAQAL